MSRRPPTPRWPTTGRLAVVAGALVLADACSSAPPPGRPVEALGRSVRDDEAVRAAEQALAEGSLARSGELWAEIARAHPADALGALATLRLARLDLAVPDRARVERARARLGSLPPGLDAPLALRRSLVEALVAARAERPDPALAQSLSTLRGRFVDAQDVVEANCALVAVTPSQGAALEALARVEGAVERGTRWPPTGLACDEPATRSARLESALAAVDEPAEVAAVLDALPAGHAWRPELARRLRTVAEARGEVRSWMSHLADLPDDEVAIRPAAPGAGAATVRIGVLAPLSGTVANVGAEAVRAVQQAVEGLGRVEVVLEDECRALPRRAAVGRVEVTDAAALVASLRERGAAFVVGPALDANVEAVVAAARAQGLPLWVPTPGEATGEAANAVGPTLRQRADALAAAVRQRGSRVVLHLPTLPADAALAVALRAALGRRGVAIAREGDPFATHLLAGAFDDESRRRWVATLSQGAPRWVVDARTLPPVGSAQWIGVEAARGFGPFLTVTCERADRAPTELSALYHDAALAALGAERSERRPAVLGPSLGVLSVDAARARACAPAASGP